MGSQGGHQNFPFGYIPSELHGIGLPDFMTPGPPPGRPLLSPHDAQNIDSFLSHFDGGGDQNKDGSLQQFQNSMEPGHDWMMPPIFVGSETSLRPQNREDWHTLHMADFTFSNDVGLGSMAHPAQFGTGGNMHDHGFVTAGGQYDHNLLHQLHSAAQTVQSSFPSGWQQNFTPQQIHQIHQHQQQPPPPPAPTVRYGSDSHFQQNGYVPPDGQFENSTPTLDWLEAQSSATNTTQPNTEPSTQPPSPSWQKKRKFEDLHTDRRRNGLNITTNGYAGRTQPTPQSATSQQHNRTFSVSGPVPTPTTAHSQVQFKQDDEGSDEDEDADYDEDDDVESRTKSASPTGAPKAKMLKTTPKVPRARKKSTASNTPSRPRLTKANRNSTGASASSRVPLTADQKKANHTNSEQRRRDATARAYAELYDLVPELEEMGKQSTMKKLEVVVNKVQRVKNRVRQLRVALGFDVETGAPLQHNSMGHPGMITGSARSIRGPGMGGDQSGALPPDMSWPS